MKTATAKELRSKASAILETVSRGEDVVITKRGKSIAVIRPFAAPSEVQFSAVGFGIWKDRKDLGDISEWVAKLREERFRR